METTKFTTSQIEKALSFLDEKHSRSENESAKLLYNLSTPDMLYVKYTNYGIGSDNGIWSDLVVLCINKDGETSDCYKNLNGIKEKVTFGKDFVEIAIDENRNMSIV